MQRARQGWGETQKREEENENLRPNPNNSKKEKDHSKCQDAGRKQKVLVDQSELHEATSAGTQALTGSPGKAAFLSRESENEKMGTSLAVWRAGICLNSRSGEIPPSRAAPAPDC